MRTEFHMRKNYIDNLRTFSILLLFPFHTAMIYNNWNELFYVNGTREYIPSLFNVIVYPWWMTLLFTMAGISSFYALQNKSVKKYVLERIKKLLIPLLVGLVVLIPPQSYIADVFHNGYSGNIFQHFLIFCTKITDFTGADGGFTPGHLWFVLYLFIVSIIMIPLMSLYIKSKKKLPYKKFNIIVLMSLFIIVLVCTPILEIGKSIGEALACFALGFYVLSNDIVQDKLVKYRWLLGGAFLGTMLLRIWLFNIGDLSGIWCDIVYRIYSWMGILFLLGFTKKYFNMTNKTLTYLSQSSFSLYYFHQTILVIIAFFTIKIVDNVWIQMLIIMMGTFVISVILYEICRRFKTTSFLFGIKYCKHKVINKL